MKKRISIICLLFLGTLSACYYDNFEEINPGIGLQGCNDTTGSISFAAKVLPIMQSSCGTNDASCHQNNASSGFYEFNTKAGVLVSVSDNNFIQSIRHDVGARAMPKNGGKLDACSIAVIEKWLATGMAD